MQKQHSFGFTLIELLFVVAIGIMLATVGVPSYLNMVKNSRLTASVNDVVTAIQLTRSEASKRGVAVTLCPSSDSNADSPSCSTSAGWEEGFIAFVDINADGTFNGDDELVLVQSAASRDIFVESSDTLADGITYGGDGFPLALAEESANLVFCDDPDDDRRARVLNVSSTGRPRVLRDTDVPSDLQCGG